jgi:hypothetical protein
MRHALALAGRSGGLVAVENRIVRANSTTVTLSGLSGNKDGVYLLVGKLVNQSGAAPYYALRPNGLTTNLRSLIVRDDGASWGAPNRAANGRFAFAPSTSAHWCSFALEIHASKVVGAIAGIITWQGQFTPYDPTIPIIYGGLCYGAWNETATELVSLDIVSESANGIGQGSQITLYKFAA